MLQAKLSQKHSKDNIVLEHKLILIELEYLTIIKKKNNILNAKNKTQMK